MDVKPQRSSRALNRGSARYESHLGSTGPRQQDLRRPPPQLKDPPVVESRDRLAENRGGQYWENPDGAFVFVHTYGLWAVVGGAFCAPSNDLVGNASCAFSTARRLFVFFCATAG